MKLYATTKSNRATKGQGGDYLEISVKNEKKYTILILYIENKDLKIACAEHWFENITWNIENIKGKQDKRTYSITDKVDDREIDYDIKQEQKGNQKKGNPYHSGDKVLLNNDSRLYTVHTIYNENSLSLGLFDFPETEQDYQIEISQIRRLVSKGKQKKDEKHTHDWDNYGQCRICGLWDTKL